VNISLKDWILFFVLSGIWGSSFFLMKHSMFTSDGSPIFNSAQVASIRMLVASSILLPIGIRNFKYIKNKKILFSLLAVGFCGNFFPAFLFTYAQKHLDAGYVGMLNSATPIFTVLLSFFIYKERLSPRQITGLIIGNIGVVLLVNSSGELSFEGNILNVLAVVLATLFYAISLNIIKYNLASISAIQITSLAFSFTFLPAILLFFYFNTPAVFLHNTEAIKGLGYASTLALFGTVLGVYLYNILIARTSTLFSSSVTYAIPCVALLIGFLDKERFTLYQITSLCIILTGIFVANWRKKKSLSLK
jgi:drug/metabolite transporter (DMT)-like permease